MLPPDIAQHLQKNRLLSEVSLRCPSCAPCSSSARHLSAGRRIAQAEWRALGVQQSRGWQHYAIHRPEPHIMLFR